jgi:hypothetical protein
MPASMRLSEPLTGHPSCVNQCVIMRSGATSSDIFLASSSLYAQPADAVVAFDHNVIEGVFYGIV